MLVAAVQMFLKWQPKAATRPPRTLELFSAGAVIGSTSALAAVGGGFLSIAYLGYHNLEIKKAVGTSAAMGFPIAVTASIGYLVNGWSSASNVPCSLGFIYLPAFLTLAVVSAVAVPHGVRFSHRLSRASLKRVFAVISLALSLKMLFSLWV